VTLVAGPVSLPTPAGVTRMDVETARQMAAAVDAALPADVAIMVAAVADWRVEPTATKIKKRAGGAPPALALAENPDILAGLSRDPRRPRLVVGFAAETDALLDNAQAKLTRKGCDWIVANDVSGDVMGGADTHLHLLSAAGTEDWGRMSKTDGATRLIGRVTAALGQIRS
jgi:phosphopantothenoylcysteine decarboxylase/phosphopantothenate--cysteine ligase